MRNSLLTGLLIGMSSVGLVLNLAVFLGQNDLFSGILAIISLLLLAVSVPEAIDIWKEHPNSAHDWE